MLFYDCFMTKMEVQRAGYCDIFKIKLDSGKSEIVRGQASRKQQEQQIEPDQGGDKEEAEAGIKYYQMMKNKGIKNLLHRLRERGGFAKKEQVFQTSQLRSTLSNEELKEEQLKGHDQPVPVDIVRKSMVFKKERSLGILSNKKAAVDPEAVLGNDQRAELSDQCDSEVSSPTASANNFVD